MIDVRNVGRHLGRSRHENGWVEKIGKHVKKWRGNYHVYAALQDGTEKRLRRKITLGECAAMNKGDAEDKLRDFIREARGQRVAIGPSATVFTLCEDYFRIQKGDWQEPGVVRSVLDQLVKPAIGHMEVGHIEPEHLKAMINSLPERQWKTPKGHLRTGCSESYGKKCIRHTRAVFDLAVAKDLIKKNPARDPVVRLTMPKGLRKPDKSYLAFADMPRLLAQLNAEDHLVIHIALVCALRPSEIFALKRNDVADGWIRVDEALDRKRNVKDPKTDSSKAKVSAPPLLLRELNDWLRTRPGDPPDLLFPNRDGRPRNRQNELNRMLKPAAKRAGLGKVTFQMLRRTFSTRNQGEGNLKSIQAQMRHARPDTTAEIYMQPIPEHQKQMVAAYEEMIFGKTGGSVQ